MEDFQIPEWQNKEAENSGKEQLIIDASVDTEKPRVVPDSKSEGEASLNDSAFSKINKEDSDSADTEDSKDNAVLTAISELNEKLDQMNGLFIKKIQHTSHEEKIVDMMHTELQKYKDDLYAQLVRPILLDIIEIRESIRRVSSNYLSRPEAEQVVPLKTFSDYTFDIQDVLEKNNITIYDSKEGDEFSPLKQRAIKKITTPVEELHGKVAESLSNGYDYMGKTIFAERVVVYVYEKTAMTEGENKNG